jgi:ketosteroid isomerase-like protein
MMQSVVRQLELAALEKCYGNVKKLTKDAIQDIEFIHSSWLRLEIAGGNHKLMAFCADDVQFWPPDGQPLFGRVAVSARITQQTKRVHCIEISDRQVRGSNEIAYLTAGYKTTFSLGEDSPPQQVRGNHLWILRKQTIWVVTLVSWSILEIFRVSPNLPPFSCDSTKMTD